MPFEDLDRGDKLDLHLYLYDKEVKILDGLAERYNCSRSAIMGELLVMAGRDKKLDLRDRIPTAKAPEKRMRRRDYGGGR